MKMGVDALFNQKENSMRQYIIALVAMSLLLVGCGKKANEKVAENMIEAQMAKDGVKANVDLSGQKVTIQTKDGTTTYAGGKGAKVPDTFPKDVFVYGGATVMAAVTVPGGQNLVLETKDDLNKILTAYKSKMTGADWTEGMSLNQPDHSMLVYKKDNRTASIVIAHANKGSQITLTVAESK
jgi:hypothetical protein